MRHFLNSCFFKLFCENTVLSMMQDSNEGEKLNDEQGAKLSPISLHSVKTQPSIVVLSSAVTIKVQCSNVQDLNVK